MAHYIMVGKELADADCCNDLVAAKNILLQNLFPTICIRNKRVRIIHLSIGLTVPLIHDNAVSLDDGTAFVHCAPGCGPEDYEVGVKNNLEIFSPISPDGKYTAGIDHKN